MPNEYIRHRQIIRGLVITHILTSNLIDRINRQNTRLEVIVGMLALLSFIASVVQIVVALR